jgi:hypothetical protein
MYVLTNPFKVWEYNTYTLLENNIKSKWQVFSNFMTTIIAYSLLLIFLVVFWDVFWDISVHPFGEMHAEYESVYLKIKIFCYIVKLDRDSHISMIRCNPLYHIGQTHNEPVHLK